MRLEEWQKYIESQFLDDEPEPESEPAPPLTPLPVEASEQIALPLDEAPTPIFPPAAPEPAAAAQSAPPQAADCPTDIPAFRPAPASPEEAPAETQDVPVLRADDSEAIPVFRAPSVSRLDSSPEAAPAPEAEEADTPRFTARPELGKIGWDVPEFLAAKQEGGEASEPVDIPVFRVSRPQSKGMDLQSPAPASRPDGPTVETTASPIAFDPISELDADIPSFSNYLPPSRRGTPEEAASAAPAPETPLLNQAQEVVVAEVAVTAPAESVTPEREEAPAPSSAAAAASVVPNAESGAAPAEAPRAYRVPQRRARHARNVRPQSVPSGLSAAELWAKVPKHVQTLLALEREEQEIAQHSYKRPFEEKRRELIERLLDPILSLEDTARLLNVCPTTVRRYTNKGILTHYRKEPDRSTRGESSKDKETRQRRFRLSDILAFLEAQQAAIEADRQAERAARRASARTNAGQKAARADQAAPDAAPGDLSAS
ncbi:MAG TPA: helix-turn-helix domain-containing protein [Chthonomonadaceae bacterium]|nr:helix-turn-helix domain-containing protein [Chthonomonadaceae bacterium]